MAAVPIDLGRVNRLNARKILPLLLLGYVLNTLDKNNIGFASLYMDQELGFTPAVFGLGAGMFFVTYALLEIPSNLLLRRFGARKWLARILITWGLISMGMAFIQGTAGFYTVRMLLGAAEAGWFPGVLLYLSCWFPAAFRARACTLFFLGAPVAAVLGSPLSGALLMLPPVAGVANWQWLFIIEGLPSVVLGVVVLVTLRDGPAGAGWLSREEQAALTGVLAAERAHGGDDATGRWHSLLTPQLLALSLINFLSGIGLYGTFIWIPRLINGFGKMTSLEIGLLAAIPFLFASLILLVSAWSSDTFRDRKWHVAGLFFIGACALGGVSASASPIAAMAFLTVAIMGAFGVQGVFFALITDMLASMRSPLSLAAGLAIITTCGNLGGFVGPYGIGLFVSAFGGFGYALVAVGGVFALAAVLIAFLPGRPAVAQQPAPFAAAPVAHVP